MAHSPVAEIPEIPQAVPAADAERIRLLARGDEAFLIGVPIVSIAVCAAFQLLGDAGFSFGIPDSAKLATNLVLMNGVHVTFTFVLLVSVPELRKWSRSGEIRARRGWAKGMGFWKRTALIAAALTAIAWVLRISPDTKNLRGMVAVFLFVDFFTQMHHGLSQMRGISLCYNSNIRKQCRLSELEQAMARRSEAWERRLFSAMLAGQALYWLPGLLEPDHLAVPGLEAAHRYGGYAIPLAAFGLILNALWFPRQEKTHKALFLARIVLLPLQMLTDTASLAMGAAHGTEYLMVFKKMVQSSSVSPVARKRVFRRTSLVALLYALVFAAAVPFVAYSVHRWLDPGALLGAALLLTFVIRYTHYYLDSVLFRMSEPATRAAVAPLLVTDPSRQGPSRAA